MKAWANRCEPDIMICLQFYLVEAALKNETLLAVVKILANLEHNLPRFLKGLKARFCFFRSFFLFSSAIARFNYQPH